MSWAEIKKALNSTVGTEDFKPLDEIIKDAIASTQETVEQATPTIQVSASGVITASVTQTEGYVTGGTKSATRNLPTQSAARITPSTSDETAVQSGRYTTGNVVVDGDSNLIASNIKSGVSIFGVLGSYVGSGGSTPSGNTISGTWYFYQQIVFSTFEQSVNFTSNGQSFVKIKGDSNELYYVKADETEVLVYDHYNGTGLYAPWVEQAYMTITFTSAQSVSADFFELFVSLASQKQSDSSSGGSATIPTCTLNFTDEQNDANIISYLGIDEYGEIGNQEIYGNVENGTAVVGTYVKVRTRNDGSCTVQMNNSGNYVEYISSNTGAYIYIPSSYASSTVNIVLS